MSDNEIFMIKLPNALAVVFDMLKLDYSNIKSAELVEAYIEAGNVSFNNTNDTADITSRIANVLFSITNDKFLIDNIINTCKPIVDALFNELLLRGQTNKVVYVQDVNKRQIVCASYIFVHGQSCMAVDLLE